MMTVRRSTYEDLPQLMAIYREARQIMLDSGDLNQWKEGYPPEELIRQDIARGVSYCVEDGGRIVGAFAFIPGTDPTYLRIEGGTWKDDTSPYGTIHRLGSLKSAHGVAQTCFDWCWERIRNLRVDTHEDNVIMRHCIARAGFDYCGIIHLLNGDPRLAFQKIEAAPTQKTEAVPSPLKTEATVQKIETAPKIDAAPAPQNEATVQNTVTATLQKTSETAPKAALLATKKLAMFDMDGVLYDSMPLHAAAWKKAMAEYGLDVPDGAIYLHEGRTGRNTVEILYGPGMDGEAMYARKCRVFESYPKPPVMPGAADAVLAARKAGLETIVVTGSGQDTILSRLRSDFGGMFKTEWMVTGRDVVHGKPDAEPYLRGLQHAGVKPEEAIVVENAPLGVQAGHAAGCTVLAVNTGPLPDSALLDAGADFLFHSMSELAEFLGR